MADVNQRNSHTIFIPYPHNDLNLNLMQLGSRLNLTGRDLRRLWFNTPSQYTSIRHDSHKKILRAYEEGLQSLKDALEVLNPPPPPDEVRLLEISNLIHNSSAYDIASRIAQQAAEKLKELQLLLMLVAQLREDTRCRQAAFFAALVKRSFSWIFTRRIFPSSRVSLSPSDLSH